MKIKFYSILFLAIFPFISNAQQLKVNEIMASNAATLASDLGNFGDWIEIYNPSNSPVDLAGMFITDDISNPTKYQFPTGNIATIIPPNGFKLVWADDSTVLLHTNFKLNGTDGEAVILFAADGNTLIDSVIFGPQNSDVSYGSTTDGGTTWTTFSTPTPEASNDPTTLQNNLTVENTIAIFPNPAQEIISVIGISWNSIQLIDLTGKIVLNVSASNLNQQIINISSVDKGVYLVQIISNKYVYTKRLIKH